MFPEQLLEAAIRDEIASAITDRPTPREPWEPEIDSLVMVRVILRIEEEIAIELPDDVMPAGGLDDVDAWVRSVMQSCRQRWQASQSVPQGVT
jgi:acyl carrier protein